MASFSHYASKFLNQSQPIFYSVQGDDQPVHDDDNSPFHDHRDRRQAHTEEYDPFNLEEIADQDEDDVDNDGHHQNDEEVLDDGGGGNDVQDSLPLLLQSQSKWRQHVSPSPPRSPVSSTSLSAGSPPMNLDMLLEESLPPPALSQPSRMTTQQTLTESLLPRSATADSFLLPVVGRTPRRKFHDLPWAYTWFVALGICALGSVITLFAVSVSIPSFGSPVVHVQPPRNPHSHELRSSTRPSRTQFRFSSSSRSSQLYYLISISSSSGSPFSPSSWALLLRYQQSCSLRRSMHSQLASSGLERIVAGPRRSGTLILRLARAHDLQLAATQAPTIRYRSSCPCSALRPRAL